MFSKGLVFTEPQNKKISTKLICCDIYQIVFLAPPTGLEPATYGLTVRRSTD